MNFKSKKKTCAKTSVYKYTSPKVQKLHNSKNETFCTCFGNFDMIEEKRKQIWNLQVHISQNHIKITKTCSKRLIILSCVIFEHLGSYIYIPRFLHIVFFLDLKFMSYIKYLEEMGIQICAHKSQYHFKYGIFSSFLDIKVGYFANLCNLLWIF